MEQCWLSAGRVCCLPEGTWLKVTCFWGSRFCYSALLTCRLSEESGLLTGHNWLLTRVFFWEVPHGYNFYLSAFLHSSLPSTRTETRVLTPFLGTPWLSYFLWGHFLPPLCLTHYYVLKIPYTKQGQSILPFSTDAMDQN